MPRFKLLASFSCLCSEGLIFPTSGSQTVTSSFVEAIGDGIRKFAPDSYASMEQDLHIATKREIYNWWKEEHAWT